MERPRLIPLPRPDFRPMLARLDYEVQLRMRDHGTAADFHLSGAPPATYEAVPLFEPEPEPDHGPPPPPGQLTLDQGETIR